MTNKSIKLITASVVVGGISVISSTGYVSADVATTTIEQNSSVKATSPESDKLNTLKNQQDQSVTDKIKANDQATTQKSEDLKKQGESLSNQQAQETNDYDNSTKQQVANQKAADNQAVNDTEKKQATDYQNVAHQSEIDTDNKKATLNADPAISAQSQRDAATNDYNQTTSQATNDLNNANQKAYQAQQTANASAQSTKDMADKTAQVTKDTADTNADYTLHNATQVANDTQVKTNTQVQTTKTNADKIATDKKNTDTNSAQSAHDNSSEVKSEQSAVSSAQKQVTDTQKVVDDAIKNAPYIATPNTDSSNPVNAQNDPHAIHQEENLPTSLQDPKLPADKLNDMSYDFFGLNLDKDDSADVTNGISDSQQKELADATVTWLNDWRSRNGLSPVSWTATTQKVTEQIVASRKNNGMGFQHSSRNVSVRQDLQDIASTNGLRYSSENMGVYNGSARVTMTGLKTAILNSIMAMIYQDGDSNFGHLNNFKNMTSIGFAAQHNTSADANEFPYILIFDMFTSADGTPMSDKPDQLSTTFANTYRKNVGPTTAQYKAASDAKVTLANAQSKLANTISSIDAKLASTLASIATTYNNSIAQNKSIYDAAIQSAQSVHDNAISNAQPIHNKAVADAQTAYDNAIAQNKSTYNKSVLDANISHDNLKEKAQATYNQVTTAAKTYYDQKMSEAKDETPENRDARHATTFAAFQAHETAKLQSLKDQQAKDLEALKSSQNQKLVSLQSERAFGREALLTQQAHKLADYPAKSAKELATFKSQLDNELKSLQASNKINYDKAFKDSQARLASFDTTIQHNNRNVVIYDKTSHSFVPYDKETIPSKINNTNNIVHQQQKEAFKLQSNGSLINENYQLVDKNGHVLTRSLLPKTAVSNGKSFSLISELLIGLGIISLVATKKNYKLKKHN